MSPCPVAPARNTCLSRPSLCPLPSASRSDAYLAAQQACSWVQGKAVESFQQRDNAELHVGVMGAGHMGSATIHLLLVSGAGKACMFFM